MEIPGIESNLGSYGSGDGPWIHGEILKGAYREDLEDVVTGTGAFNQGWDPSSTHFWNVDDSDFGKTPITTVWRAPVINAYNKAFLFINGGWRLHYLGSVYVYKSLFDLYLNGNLHWVGEINEIGEEYPRDEWIVASPELRRVLVWEILGRVCHLLADMTVPAHVKIDPHPCWLGDNDNYEIEIASAGNGTFNCDIQVSQPGSYSNYTAQTSYNSGSFINPQNFDFDNPLRYLFYYCAQISDHFASNDICGDNFLDNNPYPGMQEYINSFGPPIPEGQVNTTEIANTLMNLSIRATASLLYWFSIKCDLMKSITITSNQAGFMQIRNPSLSISPSSQYYWKQVPYTIKFDNSITVDLLADAYAGDFVGWEIRDKDNFAFNMNSGIEWLDANSQSTATFVALYQLYCTLSLNPILIESSGTNVYYKNITTGEISNTFSIPLAFPTSIQAFAPSDYIFLGWSDGLLNNPRSVNITSNTQGIFASFKKIKASNNANTYSNTSQRKFVRTNNNIIYNIYESLDRIWLEKSTDSGAT